MGTSADSIFATLARFLQRPAVLASIVALVILPLILPGGTADPDLFARVAVGWLVSTRGEVPDLDPFAFTPRLPQWIDHEWLAGVVFYHLSQLGGDGALIGFSALTFFLSAWLLARAQWTLAPHSPWHLGVLLFVMADSRYLWASVVRAQVFTYLFLAVWLVVLADYLVGRRTRFLLVLPLTMIPWCNLHGGFVVGLGLLGGVVATEIALKAMRRSAHPLSPLIGSLLLAVAATACNPYGLEAYWRYILHAVSMPRPSISEWRAPVVLSYSMALTHLGSLVVLLAILRRGVRSYSALTLCVLALVAAYRHERLGGIALFAVGVMWPLLFSAGVSSPPRSANGVKLARAAGIALVVIAMSGIFSLVDSVQRGGWRLSYDAYPMRATQWLMDRRVKGDLLVDFNNGSFALWRLYPLMRVSLDGRYEELYPESTVTLVSRALNPASPGQQEALADLDPDVVLASVNGGLESSEQWRECYRDERFRLLFRVRDLGSRCEDLVSSGSLRPSMWDHPLPETR